MATCHAGETASKRKTTYEIDNTTAKRGKFSFNPSLEQQRVHRAVTSEAYRGKSPTEFVESVVSSSEMWAYPGVATRVYDLEFGSRGLSFLHFSPVDQMLRLRKQRDNFINMSDFSVSAKFMPASDPTSWEDVLAGANGFQQYCFVRCDPVTQYLATSLYNFIVDLKTRQIWPQSMLLTLSLWIDAQLEKYRSAVVTDIDCSTATRNLVAASFTSNNIELHGLLLAEQRNQVETLHYAKENQDGRRNHQSRQPWAQRTSNGNGRKEQNNSYLPLPQHDGKEVCIKFLSKKGCPSTDPDVCVYASRVHFYPAAISSQLRAYIRRKFGGVNSKYTNN